MVAKGLPVGTKQLKESIRTNRDPFPEDFIFELSVEEYKYFLKQGPTLFKFSKNILN